jgi:polyamine oxidase
LKTPAHTWLRLRPSRCPLQITAGGASYKADFAVITVPAGVLKAGKINFSPALPAAKRTALKGVAMGVLNKVVLSMPSASSGWSGASWFERLPLAEDGGKWREFFSYKKIASRDVMVAFNAGDSAKYPAATSDDALVSQAVKALNGMFPSFGAPTQTWVTRWHDDEWTLGSYSVLTTGARGNERKALAANVKNVLYFAGEHTSTDYPATVQGAYISGGDAAKAASSYWK